MTTRDKFSTESRSYTYEFYSRVGKNGSFSLADKGGATFVLVSERFGEKNPDWWRQVRYGQGATTIASGTVDRIIGGPFLASLTFDAGFAEITRLVQGDPHLTFLTPPIPIGGGVFTGLSDSVRNGVLIRFLQKCAAEQRKLFGGVLVGEMRQTIRLIRNPLSSLEKAIQQYARACRGRARRLSPRLIPKMLSEEYLSFTYGVEPLLADIKGAYDAGIRLRDLPELTKVRAAFEKEHSFKVASETVQFYDIGALKESHQYAKVLGVIRGAVKMATVGPAPPLMEVTGTRLRDFIPTVYELIPYSFVVDYFTNIGDVLDCFSFFQADLAWHNQTLRISSHSTELFSKLPSVDTIFGLPIKEYTFNSTYAQRSLVSFARGAQPLGLPSVEFQLPRPKQWFNLAALGAAKTL